MWFCLTRSFLAVEKNYMFENVWLFAVVLDVAIGHHSKVSHKHIILYIINSECLKQPT